jgi:hypothetical protein
VRTRSLQVLSAVVSVFSAYRSEFSTGMQDASPRATALIHAIGRRSIPTFVAGTTHLKLQDSPLLSGRGRSPDNHRDIRLLVNP